MARSVDSLYKSAPLPHRKTMLEMRKRILEIVPDAEEVISYGMPAFKVNGNVIAGLSAAKNHVGYYPFSGSVLHLFSNELQKYSITKSAIHVPVQQPLPKTLIRKLLNARISQCPVKKGAVNLSSYAKQDGFWRELGLAAPARRGLIDKGILALRDLKFLTRDEFLEIHGIGNSASEIVTRAMRVARISFKKKS